MAATFTLVVGLVMQAVVLSLYLGCASLRSARHRAVLEAVAVRRADGCTRLAVLVSRLRYRDRRQRADLALIEVLFAQMVARVMFGQRTTVREAIGMALVVAGVGLLIFAER